MAIPFEDIEFAIEALYVIKFKARRKSDSDVLEYRLLTDINHAIYELEKYREDERKRITDEIKRLL
jgi:hypothetical protein